MDTEGCWKYQAAHAILNQQNHFMEVLWMKEQQVDNPI